VLPDYPLATLALATGDVFHGYAIGNTENIQYTHGEVVFNTAMTGYQEILTDPSYANQIVTLTSSHIGNTGVNIEDIEALKIHAAGLIIKNLPSAAANFRANQDLLDYLQQNNILAIAGIDTRKLTRILRIHGAQNGAIATAANIEESTRIALEAAHQFSGLDGLDLAKEVTTPNTYTWTEGGEWKLGQGYISDRALSKALHIVAYDFGIKRNILRMLAQRGCSITVVPAKTNAQDVMRLKPDGVFLSNGPGDPAACDYAIEATKILLAKNIPIFGICLGHQILALACGAKTLKMKFGHHGANHPVQDLASKRVMITSQNHGFSVDETTLGNDLFATHRSLFDGSLQGIQHKTYAAFGFQGHPEASPGPHDLAMLFDAFIARMQK
jgi:carbamoyl-phosphate synthase small subunit